MRSKILVMLALALVCGGASMLVARNFLNGAAEARMKAIADTRPETAFGTLVVAAEPLRFGAVLGSANLKTIPWPEGEAPAGAFTTVDELTGGEQRIVLMPLEAGEPVLSPKITGPGERAGLSRLISEGRRAVTVRVNDVAGVAGFVLPGDRVDVVLTIDDRDAMRAEVVLQGVRVLTADQVADERATDPVLAKAVTLEVDAAGAQKLALAQAIGTLSLVLRRAGEDGPAPVRSISLADVAGGSQPMAEPAARRREAAPMPAPAPAAGGVVIGVTRAMERTEVRVPARLAPATASPGATALAETLNPLALTTEPASDPAFDRETRIR